MTLRTLLLATVCMPLAAMAVVPPAAHMQSREVPGQVLVRFQSPSQASKMLDAKAVPQAPGQSAAAMALKSRLGLRLKERLLDGQIEHLDLPAFLRVEDAVAQLKADPAVAWTEPVYLRQKFVVRPNDPNFNQQWPLENTGQTGSDGRGSAGADLGLTRAWDANNDGIADRSDSSSVRIAIIDDGFELGHPDLAASLNTALGHDFHRDGSDDTDPSPVPGNSDTHGTLVSGAAGAVGNNGIGISGVAWASQLIPIRFEFDSASEVRAIDYARSQGAKVVNASYGGPDFSQAEHDAIAALGAADILFVAAAGNFDSNTDFAKASYPANYDLDNILAVAASTRTDSLAGFSQYGPMSVDVAAPGFRILTTAVGGGYQTVSGTSFSAPYAAGVAALIRTSFPAASAAEVKARMIETASTGLGLQSLSVGGRVDANASLNLTTQPSLVLAGLRIDDSASGDNDGALDPGESANVVLKLKNLWAAGSGLTLALTSGSSNVRMTGGSQIVAALAGGATTSVSFPLTVSVGANNHEVVDFTLQISSASYSAQRHFNAELGRLDNGVTTNASFSGGNRDEFQSWQFDLPSLPVGHTQLVVSSSAARDIDLLVKQGSPPQYLISLGVDPEAGGQTFYTDAPPAQIGGGADGNETVRIDNPATGTWFVTVVNYTQGSNLPYTLQFKTEAPSAPPPATGGGTAASGGGGGGGSALGVVPLILALLRRKKTC